MISGIDDVFTTSDNSGLIAMLNDAIIHDRIAEYQTALRVAESEAHIFEQCGNDRMALLMTNQVTHYRNRIEALQQQLEGGE